MNAGNDCRKGYCDAYADVYATPPQTISSYGQGQDAVLFQSQGAVSSCDFDLSKMSTDGSIRFLKEGLYSISWDAQASFDVSVPDPKPNYIFGLWKQNEIVPGSIVAGYPKFPNDSALHFSGETTLAVHAGDVIKFRNASAYGVSINPNSSGIHFPVTGSSLRIRCIRD